MADGCGRGLAGAGRFLFGECGEFTLQHKQQKRKLGSLALGAWGQLRPSLALGPTSLVAVDWGVLSLCCPAACPLWAGPDPMGVTRRDGGSRSWALRPPPGLPSTCRRLEKDIRPARGRRGGTAPGDWPPPLSKAAVGVPRNATGRGLAGPTPHSWEHQAKAQGQRPASGPPATGVGLRLLSGLPHGREATAVPTRHTPPRGSPSPELGPGPRPGRPCLRSACCPHARAWVAAPLSSCLGGLQPGNNNRSVF